MGKKQVLGKGIHALIAEYGEQARDGEAGRQIVNLPVAEIDPNPHQPRMDFEEGALDQLTASIREKGVIQPISVNRVGQSYHIIAGERRWRASKMAGFDTVPAIIHEIESEEELIELSLIENIQREDLNPIEEAEGYRALRDTCMLTQEEIAQKVGRDRSTVANMLRLLNLPEEIQKYLRSGTIQMGHARALSALDEEASLRLGRKAVKEGLSVRELEKAVRSHGKKREHPKSQDRAVRADERVLAGWEEKLRLHFGTAVEINRKSNKGRVEIEFYSDDDLERILDLLLAG
ncbi:MAG: ParB/RepB/Spo0J family partition protein [Chloroflexi bacterium]|nr:ParB/RepB/Spo0J family partition protein [Chloroflexota bacterium]